MLVGTPLLWSVTSPQTSEEHWLCCMCFNSGAVKSSSYKDLEHLASAAVQLIFKTVYNFSCGSRNRPPTVSAGDTFPARFSSTRPTPVSAGLTVTTNCIWMREDGELLLRPAGVKYQGCDANSMSPDIDGIMRCLRWFFDAASSWFKVS
ncbi:hypothetical protein Tco_0618308 [Tanacetum coccineum]